MAKFKKGDIVEIVPGIRDCLEVQAQYGKKHVVERVTVRYWGLGYILKGVAKDGLPFLFPESSLQLCEQQLSFPGF